MPEYLVAALYKFVRLEDYEALQKPIREKAVSLGVKGSLLLAREGINGTVAGTAEGIQALLDYLRQDPRLADLDHKESHATEMPFQRMKVRLKKEIVTMGVEDVDPNKIVGTYVNPQDWNALISDPDVVVVDTRNDYEVAIGTFKGALDPETKSFREFPDWVKSTEHLAEKPRVAMFCTGGIRCEKSTAYLKEQGFDEVYHLKGGILKYLEEVPQEESLWHGECFVFDERVSVGHGLEIGDYDLCRACRRPLDAEDKKHEHYERGVSCAWCHGETSQAQKASYRERQRQADLADKKGIKHVGFEASN